MAGSIARRLAGPGLIFSGAAIGTSHLVQSTRAGAIFGAALIVVIVLINLLKYPAYRFGVDFTHSRGRSLLTGYREVGMWALVVFIVAVLPTVPIIFAALGAATAGVTTVLVGPILPIPVLGTLILAASGGLLLVGGYRLLDKVNAVLLVFLVISTLATTLVVIPRVEWGTAFDFSWTQQASSILFIVALAGFMPNPMDCSVLLSLWKVAGDRSLPGGARPALSEARKAFAWPYVMTAFLAVCFCIMGAGVMHSAGVEPLSDAPGFSGQVVGLYREALGPAFAVLAAIAALSVLLTSVIAAMDGYARTFAAASTVLNGGDEDAISKSSYALFVGLFVGIASLALFTLLTDLTTFLDFVTSVSFLIAPVIALLNYLVITRCDVPAEAQPTAAVKAWTWLGIAVMAALAALYFVLVFS